MAFACGITRFSQYCSVTAPERQGLVSANSPTHAASNSTWRPFLARARVRRPRLFFC